MFAAGYFLKAIASVINIVLYSYLMIIIARALVSWVNPDPWNPIVRFLHQATEPVLRPLRRRIPLDMGGLDVTPVIAMLIIVFLQEFLVNTLVRLSYQLTK